MANTITHKRSSTAGAVPSGASLALGELCVNTADGRLFLKRGDGSVVAIGRDASELNAGTVAAARLPAATGSTLGAIIVGTGLGVASGTVSVSYGSSSSSACVGNDSRLSDTRTPTDGSVTTAKIVDANVTYAKIQNVSATDKLLGRSSAGAGVIEEVHCTADARAILAANNVYACRAWVNFDGRANSSLTGTYSRSGTTVTVTATAHGLAVGQGVYLDFTSGLAADGLFTVATVANANTFTVTHGTSGTTSGNVTLVRSTIRASGNVSSVADIGAGNYLINFSTAMQDGNYAACVSGKFDSGDTNANIPLCGLRRSSGNPSANFVRISTSEAGTPTSGSDAEVVAVAIFR